MPRMKNTFSAARLVAATLVAGLALTLAGCSILPKAAPDPTRHYVLAAPVVDSAATPATDTPARGSLKVGLRTVRAAAYLDGVALIVRRGDNEIDHRDYARWAEPLSVGVGRILRLRLQDAAPVARLLPQPFPFDVVRDVDVEVTVLRAEAAQLADGRRVVSFVCTYEIIRAVEGAGAGELLVRETYVAPETPWREGDYAGLAHALGVAADALAVRIAERLSSVE